MRVGSNTKGIIIIAQNCSKVCVLGYILQYLGIKKNFIFFQKIGKNEKSRRISNKYEFKKG